MKTNIIFTVLQWRSHIKKHLINHQRYNPKSVTEFDETLKRSMETESYQPIHIFGRITFQHFGSENKLELINRQSFLNFSNRLVCTDVSRVPNCYASVGGNEIYRLSHHLKKYGFWFCFCLCVLLIESKTMQKHPHSHSKFECNFVIRTKTKSSVYAYTYVYVCVHFLEPLSRRVNEFTNFHAVPN